MMCHKDEQARLILSLAISMWQYKDLTLINIYVSTIFLYNYLLVNYLLSAR